eukprot:TRINITY_DN22871_c0_g1_i1.p1 TRINITY_DN22871_c0_g1~~TRINITY_DN22871_c0_g1_i1.p1  ORF type:complete len:441 (-),score=78.65 TRINITY_DN22871_c0_g1_i1:674-1996(-)
MSSGVKQPVGQKRLTNIAVVRIRRNGKRFEVACYKNKVISWRNKVEKDIDEVLQTRTVFANVGKGTLAKAKDLKEAFGTDDEEKVSREILDKGEFQVSDKEREVAVSSQFRDIASIVMEKTVNPDTQRPYTMGLIEKFIHELHFSVEPHKSSKQQALELIGRLRSRFPITRARMELRLGVPAVEEPRVLAQLQEWDGIIQSTHASTGPRGKMSNIVCQVDPGRFRACEALASELHGALDVISMAVQKEGEVSFDTLEDSVYESSRNANPRAMDDGSVFVDKLAAGMDLGGKRLGHSSEAKRSGVQGAGVSSEEGQEGADGRNRILGGASLGGGASSIASGGPQTRSDQSGTSTATADADFATGGAAPAPAPAPTFKFKCNTCGAGAGFNTSQDHREHFKSDWHKHNLKRKLQQLPPLSADEWQLDTELVERKSDLHEYSR